MPMPDSIVGAPTLRPGLEPYWHAFNRLTTERAPGSMGPPGRIPWSAIHRYATAYAYAGDDYEDLMDLIFAMDEAFMGHVEKLHAKDGEPPIGQS